MFTEEVKLGRNRVLFHPLYFRGCLWTFDYSRDMFGRTLFFRRTELKPAVRTCSSQGEWNVLPSRLGKFDGVKMVIFRFNDFTVAGVGLPPGIFYSVL